MLPIIIQARRIDRQAVFEQVAGAVHMPDRFKVEAVRPSGENLFVKRGVEAASVKEVLLPAGGEKGLLLPLQAIQGGRRSFRWVM